MANELKINKGSSDNSSILLITLEGKGKVFEIKSDGSVGYTVKGKYKIADTDKKLGIALGEAFEALVEINRKSIESQNENQQ